MRLHIGNCDTIMITMTIDQCRMARAGLRWTIDELASAAGIGRATVARFEGGRPVDDASIQAIRLAFSKKRVRFVEDGPLKGAVYVGLRPRK